MLLYSATRDPGVPSATSDGMASAMLATKICPSNTSNTQPREATARTSHW
jgi:hypothetical protein